MDDNMIIYYEGRNAFMHGGGYDNPYPHGSNEFYTFLEGFEEADAEYVESVLSEN